MSKYVCCEFDGCEEPPQRNGFCWGHTRQQEKGYALTKIHRKEKLSPLGSLEEAALEYADAESQREFEKAREKLKGCAKLFATGVASKVIVPKGRPSLRLWIRSARKRVFQL